MSDKHNNQTIVATEYSCWIRGLCHQLYGTVERPHGHHGILQGSTSEDSISCAKQKGHVFKSTIESCLQVYVDGARREGGL